MSEGEDDLYAQFNEEAAKAAEREESLLPPGSSAGTAQRAVASRAGRNSLTTSAGASRKGTAAAARPQTASDDTARPMTAVRAAGYSSYGDKKRGMQPPGTNAGPSGTVAGTPGSGGSIGVPPPGSSGDDEGSQRSIEDACRQLEHRVNEALEDSCEAADAGEVGRALELARDARRKERQLSKQREENNLLDQLNSDLTFAVAFNLAHKYQLNGNDEEALQAYKSIVERAKQFPQASRLRLNMGNIYFQQGRYPHAVKNYRMALDQLPSGSKALRFAITRNIGCAFVKQGYYHDATQSFETVMENAPDVQAGLNLLVCYRTLGDREKMRKAFNQLLSAHPPHRAEHEDEDEELHAAAYGGPSGASTYGAALKDDDGLEELLKQRDDNARRRIFTAARLIAPEIDVKNGLEGGFNWVSEQVRNSGRDELASELELEKALWFLRQREFDKAVSVLKEFERKDEPFRSRAACNLAFIYLLEGQVQSAEAYADLAIRADRYSAKALTNRGIVLYSQGDIQGAKSMFLEAVGVEADSSEAIYDLGLAHKRAGEYQRALEAFQKLHSLAPANQEAKLQVADCLDYLERLEESTEWLEALSSAIPSDPSILARLGSAFSRLNDEAKAVHYYTEAHKLYPADLDVASWLGAFHVRSEMYEKAMPYFQLASRVQPREPKWRLMAASCMRRTGNYQGALDEYRRIDEQFPDNIECLRAAQSTASDLNLTDEATGYAQRLRKAEAAQQQEQSHSHVERSAAEENDLLAPTHEIDQLSTSRGTDAKAKGEEDLFGDAPLGDDLLPGA